MKKITQFKCEHCGTLYSNLQECQRCEKQHVSCSSIRSEHHLPMKVCAKYPPRITVEMADGTVQTYERKSGR